MPMYEYRCTSCGDQLVEQDRLEDILPLSEWKHDDGDGCNTYVGTDAQCGPLKRTWSVGFQIKSTDWSHD